jgi:hypothetical protein
MGHPVRRDERRRSTSIALLRAEMIVADHHPRSGSHVASGTTLAGIDIKRPASGSPRIPPPRPAKRGEGWGEGPCQAGPLIPTFSPADRGEGVIALSVRPRLVPMSLAGPLRRPGRFSSAGLTT